MSMVDHIIHAIMCMDCTKLAFYDHDDRVAFEFFVVTTSTSMDKLVDLRKQYK